MLEASCRCLNIRLTIQEASSLPEQDRSAFDALKSNISDVLQHQPKTANHVPRDLEACAPGRIHTQDIVRLPRSLLPTVFRSCCS